MTLQGGQQATVVMPVVTYDNGSKRILVNRQNSTWVDSAVEDTGKLYIKYPAANQCSQFDNLITTDDFDSRMADEVVDLNGESTYPIELIQYDMLSCDVGGTGEINVKLSFLGGNIKAKTELGEDYISFTYSDLERAMIYEIEPRKIGSKYYLHFWDGQRWSLMCDVNTGKAIRCTSQGITHIDIKANCSQGIAWSADALEAVHAEHEIDAELSWGSCSLDDDEMIMTMTLAMGDCMAISRETHVLVNSQGGYLIPVWELIYV